MLMLEIFSFNKILKLKSIDTNQFKKSTFKDIFYFQIKMAVIFWHDIFSKEMKQLFSNINCRQF